MDNKSRTTTTNLVAAWIERQVEHHRSIDMFDVISDALLGILPARCMNVIESVSDRIVELATSTGLSVSDAAFGVLTKTFGPTLIVAEPDLLAL